VSPRAATTRSRRTSLSVIVAVAWVTLTLALAGCSLANDQQLAPTGHTDTSTSSGFAAPTESGEAITVPAGRPSVVLFFSVECGGCGPTATALAQVQAADPGAADFVVVDVAAYETAKDIKEFLAANSAHDLTYTIDTQGQLVADYQVTQLSTVLILDSDNTVAFRAIEPSTDQIRAELAKVTNNP